MAPQSILIGDDDRGMCQLLALLLQDAGYLVRLAYDGYTLIREAQERIPDLILVDLVMPRLDGYEALRQLRNDTRTAHVPAIIVSARNRPADLVDGLESGADDFITKPFEVSELLARIRSQLRRAARRPVASPLTGLPGNLMIDQEIRRRLAGSEAFALLHLDLSNFKSFNDVYGFARGDKAIRALADLLTAEQARQPQSFVGHVGGDDFVAISSPRLAEPLSRTVVAGLAARIRSLYDPADLARGYLEAEDRFGELRRFPIVGLVVGGAVSQPGRFANAELIGQRAAEMKQLVKRRESFGYAISLEDDTMAVGP